MTMRAEPSRSRDDNPETYAQVAWGKLKRSAFVVVVLAGLLAGCAEGDVDNPTSVPPAASQPEVGTTPAPAEQPPVSPTTLPSTTQPLTTPADDAPDDTVIPPDPVRWEQEDLPGIEGADPGRLGRVALVTEDDVLNVRQDPGVAAAIVGMLAPGVVVQRTGPQTTVGPSTWVEIATPLGNFWVNDHYLAAVVTGSAFGVDGRVESLLDQFAATIANGGDLLPAVSRRGLYLSHHSAPSRFTRSKLEGILTDPTTYRWQSNALAPDEPEFLQIPPRTFSQAITDRFLSAYDDPDTVVTFNEPIAGQNGRLPDYAIPFSLRSFNYVGVHDSGDDFAPLDWVTWYVSIDYEDGHPRIVALTIDEMAP